MGMVLHKTVDMQFSQLERAIEKDYKLNEPGSQCPPDVRAGLDAIEKEVNLLQDTWSPMTGKNIMADIVRLVASLEPRLKPASRDTAISVKKNITEMMGGYSPSKARYSSVLCLGYKVTTIKGAYTGGMSDRTDLETKVGEILTAIKNAESYVTKTYIEPSMLKIFMAPEFFFRGGRGGYDADAVNGTKTGGQKSLVQLLQAELTNDKYKDWLFVLGTVIVVSQSMKTSCDQCAGPVKFEPAAVGKTTPTCTKDAKHKVTEKVAGAHVDNLALILKEKIVHTIAKELVAGADYNPTQGERLQVLDDKGGRIPVEIHAPLGSADPGKTKFTDERLGGCIFTVDGITIGCEICLDHNASGTGDGGGRLSGDGAHDIQISLIPAGGMSIKKFRTVANGVVFNVDGDTPHVQAVGLTTKKKDLILARSGKTNTGVRYDDAYLMKNWKEMTNWVGAKASGTAEFVGAPINAPNGPVLPYGPFQIPDTV